MTQLVRMIPVSIIAFGKLIGDECYCCPICFEPKFTVRGKKAIKQPSKDVTATAAQPNLRVIEGGSEGTN